MGLGVGLPQFTVVALADPAADHQLPSAQRCQALVRASSAWLTCRLPDRSAHGTPRRAPMVIASHTNGPNPAASIRSTTARPHPIESPTDQVADLPDRPSTIAGRGHNAWSAVVDLVGALANPQVEVQRLLNLAKDWSTLPRLASPSQPAVRSSLRTARQLHSPDIERLVAAYRDGAAVGDLATRFNLHRSTVGRHLRTRGIDTRPPALTPDAAASAAGLYQQGWSLTKIADKYGVAGDTVRRRLREVGVQMRGPHERSNTA